MTKTLKISIATAIFAAALGISAYVAITAYAASSLFGGATLGGGYVTLLSQNSSDPNVFSAGILFDDLNGSALSTVGELSTDYNVGTDDCVGGSPRFSILLDMDNDGVESATDKNLHIYIGPYPNFSGCQQNTWVSTGNLIQSSDLRFDTAQIGGTFYDSWANALTLAGNKNILGIRLVIDSSWAFPGGSQAVLVDNIKISKLVSNTYEFNPPPDVTVTIVKYVDGTHANATNATSLSFPMDATWSATNIGTGSGSFELSTTGFNNPNAYEATTADMTNGASYSVSENLTGPNVGASCSEGKPFALTGYSIGDTEALAAAAATTSSAVLTGVTSDKFIIVWNETCAPAPTTGTLIVQKTVVNDDSGSDDPEDFSFSVNSDPAVAFEADGENQLTLPAGTYSVVETSASGYATTYTNSENSNLHCNSLVLAAGDTVTCTITNNDDDVPPPPPSGTACDTPTAAPSGYTLLTGTVDRDVVTLNPFTMFVGLGGNDEIKAPAAGNYIICVGNGFDKITIGDGVYNIVGGDNYKNIVAGSGNGLIKLGNGPNRIVTGNGDHDITVGDGNNNITTGTGVDVITTGNGFNRVNAGGGNDDILTGTSNDNINGGPGTDTCDAGGGFDNVTNCEL